MKQRVPADTFLPNFRDAVKEYSRMQAPITVGLVSTITVVFFTEVWLTFTHQIGSIEVLATGLFGIAPKVAWTFSPLLHRSLPHFLGNVVCLLLLGLPIERHWSRRRYGSFLFATGFLSIGAGAVVNAVFAQNQVAFYGASGIAFALAGYALVHLYRDHGVKLHSERVAVLIGLTALLLVIVDPLTGPYFDPDWFNGGHISGFLIGSVVGFTGLSSCEVNDRSF